jgi:hypothetical protein
VQCRRNVRQYKRILREPIRCVQTSTEGIAIMNDTDERYAHEMETRDTLEIKDCGAVTALTHGTSLITAWTELGPAPFIYWCPNCG